MISYGSPLSRILAALALSALASPVTAGPWLDPGDTGLRNDLQFLADRGVISSPMTTWPMSWGDLGAQLEDPGDLSEAEAAALSRVRARARDARVTGQWRPGVTASMASQPRLVRDFEDLPREKGEIAAGVEWTGNKLALNLTGQYVDDPQDGKDWRMDGSYAGVALGNWMFAAAATDRWWGPNWQGSLILSSNARPIPALVIDRNSTAPFESPWLHWIGNWDLVVLWGFLEHDRVVADTQFFGMRVTARPARWLEIGLSRTALWCGDGRPCGLDTFWDLLSGQDNAGDNVAAADEPGDQIAGYDLRLTGAAFDVPVAVYAQRIGEDEQNLFPSLFLTQMGLETWGDLGRLGGYRLYFEIADTLCGANITGEGEPDCAYDHPIYRTGMRYRGRSIAHSFDNDAKVWTFGAMLNDRHDGSWLLNAASGRLNRQGAASTTNTVAAVKTGYESVILVHRRVLPFGELQASVGMESFDDAVTGDENRDWRLSLGWRDTF